MILMPYFLSNSFTAAITTDEQSVSGMKPILTSFFSGASEPAAQAPTRTASGTMDRRPVAVAFFRNSLRFTLIHISLGENKKGVGPSTVWIAERLCSMGRFVAPLLIPTSQALCHRPPLVKSASYENQFTYRMHCCGAQAPKTHRLMFRADPPHR